MSATRRALGIAALGATAIAAVAYGAPRIAASRIRRAPDPDGPRVLEPAVRTTHWIPSHDGGVIHVVESGSGPPIVLSHGVTLSVRTWFHQLEDLPAEGFRVLAFDHRGHGRSELGTAGHSLDNLAEDVRSVLEALDLRDAVLVGHSMGGVAVQSFAIRFPDVLRERVAGIVLLSTLARAPLGSQATRLKARIERLTRRAPDTTRAWAAPNLGLLLARLGFGQDPQPTHVEMVRQMMLECTPATRRDAPAVLIGLDLVDDLRAVDVPTLVIGGTADILTPPHESRRLAETIPGARLHLVAGAGHMVMLERTAEFHRVLTDFAREAVARRHA
ncbi:MAG TPA: alpha/beta fold hydrolase [Acidimicrobiia bacterium]|nr:alpha/beta fold hydrolase [Acidimicrobiia bacterium]